LSRALDRLNIDPRDFVFVDLGSGKGRVILRAGARPFHRVEGVEFSEPLHRQAVRNIAAAKAARHLRAPVLAHNLDVTKYDLPREKLVIYSFSPFGKTVMQQFVDRLVASLRAHPRDCYFIHLNPQHPECLGDAFEPVTPSPRQAAFDRLISPWPLVTYRYRQAIAGAAAA
jgi:hypothetical protein